MHSGKHPLIAIVLIFSFCNISSGQVIPWQNIGPYMGYINQMVMDDAHPDTLYAATPYGVYKTVDGSETWIKTSLSGFEINSVKVSSVDANILIASTDSIIYKSANGGDDWSEIWKSERTIGAIALDPADVLSIWVGVNVSEFKVYSENLFHSIDGGTSWNSVAFETGEELKLSSVLDIHFDRSNASVIYVSGWGDTYHVDGGLMVSQDGGANWTNFRPGGCSSNNVVATSSTPPGYEPHAAYALVGPNCGIDKELFKSLDYGSTWIEVWNPFDANIGRSAGTVIEVEKEDPKYIMVGGYDRENHVSAFYYNSEEDSWYTWGNTPHSFPTSILSCAHGYFLSFKTHGVYQITTTNPSWVQRNQGMNDVEILDIVPYPKDPGKLMVATLGNLARTRDGGQNWTLTSNSFVKLALNEQDTSILYGGTRVSSHTFMSPFYLYKTESGGDSWAGKQVFTNSGMLDYYYTLWVGDILIWPDNPDQIIIGVDGGGACGEGLYLSTNGGSSWGKEFSTGVSSLAMDPVNKQVLYLGTSGSGYVNKSENGGLSWSLISPGGGDAFAGSVRGLMVDKNQVLFAGTSDGLFKWESGTNWSLVNGLPEVDIPAMLIDNRPDTPHIYVGTKDQGVFVSNNGGSSWEAFNNGLTPRSITTLKLDDSSPPKLYAGTENGGVWITELEAQSVFSTPPIRDGLELTVFPNPNNGTFNISTNRDSGLTGSLQITNLLGEVVYVESHIDIPAGQSRHIHVDQMAPGCYILIFTTKQQIGTKKILVEKR